MISDNQLLLNRFISVTKDYSSFNPGTFVGGIIEGILDCAEFVSLKKKMPPTILFKSKKKKKKKPTSL